MLSTRRNKELFKPQNLKNDLSYEVKVIFAFRKASLERTDLCDFFQVEMIQYVETYPKRASTIRLQDSLNSNILKENRAMNLIFCMWIDIHRSNHP